LEGESHVQRAIFPSDGGDVLHGTSRDLHGKTYALAVRLGGR